MAEVGGKDELELFVENQKLKQALSFLAEQADEDCPAEYRTEHFNTALRDAISLLKDLGDSYNA